VSPLVGVLSPTLSRASTEPRSPIDSVSSPRRPREGSVSGTHLRNRSSDQSLLPAGSTELQTRKGSVVSWESAASTHTVFQSPIELFARELESMTPEEKAVAFEKKKVQDEIDDMYREYLQLKPTAPNKPILVTFYLELSLSADKLDKGSSKKFHPFIEILREGKGVSYHFIFVFLSTYLRCISDTHCRW
jgi:hypothetical protein